MFDAMPKPEDLLPLLPGIGACLAVLLIAAFLGRKNGASHWHKLAALALPIAVLLTWQEIHSSLPWPPRQSTERALWCFFGAAALGLLPGVLRERWTLAPILQLLPLGAGLYYVLKPLIERDDASAIVVLDFLILLLGASIFGLLAREVRRCPLFTLAYGLTFVTAAQISVFYGVASIAQILATIGTALLLLTPLAISKAKFMLPVEVVPGLIAALALFGADAWFYGDDLPPLRVVCVTAGAPMAFLLFPVLARTKLKTPWSMALVAILLIALNFQALNEAWTARPEPVEDPYADFLENKDK